jgi:methylated-DNA-[protein]-cysteine S-methyltransferase
MTGKRCRIIDSPIGPLMLAGDDVLTDVRMDAQSHPPADQGAWREDSTAFADAVAQLAAYFAGELRDFDLDLRLEGTAFQRRVWAALRAIPYARTCSYGQLAADIGLPGAARAVGLANGRNPISIIVPCHRVIGANGTLTGYGGGLERKRHLLDLERAHQGGGSLQSRLFVEAGDR